MKKTLALHGFKLISGTSKKTDKSYRFYRTLWINPEDQDDFYILSVSPSEFGDCQVGDVRIVCGDFFKGTCDAIV